MWQRCTFIVLILLKIASTEYTSYETKTTEKCLCINHRSSGNFEYQCPPSNIGSRTTIHVYPTSKILRIDCNATDFLDRNYLPNADFPEITTVELRECPIPANGFEDIVKNFNIQKLEVLNFKGQTSNDTLKPEHFYGLEQLKVLDLTSNKIQNLNSSIFEKIPNLTKLYLDYNNIQLTDEIFENVPNLRHLSIMSNSIRRIPRIFENLTNLISLNLWMNNIQKIDKGAFTPLKQLKYLELSLNDLENLGEEFSDLTNILNVTLRRNKLRKISRKTLENCGKLERIELQENSNLTLLDEVFSNFSRLHIVDLSRNNIRDVPGNLFQNSINLVTISLQYNKLERLPVELFQTLVNLERLNLRNNQLDRLERSVFSSLERLEILDLSNNKLGELDENLLKNLKNLKEINLNFNQIKNLPTNILSRNFKLVKFSMGHNFYDFEKAGIFSENLPFSNFASTNLEQIDLSFNQITRYPYDLHGIISMKTLNLAHNYINELMVENLRTLNPDGLNVNLNLNNITSVQFPETFLNDTDQSITTVQLTKNPINCDCHALDFVTYVKEKNHPAWRFLNVEFDGLDCSGPGEMRGIPIINMKVENLRCELGRNCTRNQTCECSFRSLDKSIVVECSQRNLSVVPELIIEDIGIDFNQTEVYLQWNDLKKMPGESDGYSNVTKLYLQGNKIGNITWLPPLIKVLDLKYNDFRTLNNASLKILNDTDADEMHFGYNPWKCNCGTEHIANFLRAHANKVDMLDIKCNLTGKRMIEMQEYEFHPQKKNYLAVYVIIALSNFLIITALICLYYKYQQEILVWLYARGYCQWLVKEEELDKDKKYDAFLSFSHADEDFVFQNLIPVLEGGDEPYKLCVHIRDWIPGEFITNSITNSVNSSRRTIVVLSRNFLESVWGRMEFRTAHTEAMKEGRARVIMIIYGDINLEELDDELKVYIKTNTYIKWGDRWFWDRLKFGLPKKTPQRKNKRSKKHANMMRFIDGKFDMMEKTQSVNPPQISLDTKNFEEKSLTCIA